MQMCTLSCSLTLYLYSLNILLDNSIRRCSESSKGAAYAQLHQDICTLLVRTHVAQAEKRDS